MASKIEKLREEGDSIPVGVRLTLDDCKMFLHELEHHCSSLTNRTQFHAVLKLIRAVCQP